jgi:hypothetical protein
MPPQALNIQRALCNNILQIQWAAQQAILSLICFPAALAVFRDHNALQMGVLHAGLPEFLPPVASPVDPAPTSSEPRTFPRARDPDVRLKRLLTVAMCDIISVIAHFKPAQGRRGGKGGKSAAPKSSVQQLELNVRTAVATALAAAQLDALSEHGTFLSDALEAPSKPQSSGLMGGLCGVGRQFTKSVFDVALSAFERSTEDLYKRVLVNETQRLKQNEELRMLLEAAAFAEPSGNTQTGPGVGLGVNVGGPRTSEDDSDGGDGPALDEEGSIKGMAGLVGVKDMGELMGSLSDGIDEDDLKALEEELEQHFSDGEARTIIHMTGYVPLPTCL